MLDLSSLLHDSEGFDWDEANTEKILKKHQINQQEVEQVFFDYKAGLFEDVKHSNQEQRLIIIGQTENQRLLFVVFTVRGKKIRPISARDAKKKKEVILYEKTA